MLCWKQFIYNDSKLKLNIVNDWRKVGHWFKGATLLDRMVQSYAFVSNVKLFYVKTIFEPYLF